MHPDLHKIVEALHKGGVDLPIIAAVINACVHISDFADSRLTRKVGTMGAMDRYI